MTMDRPPVEIDPSIWLPLADRYEIQRLIGRGTFGAVFLATQRALQRPVAIKLLLLRDAECTERFLRESRVLAQVRHPHIIDIIECGNCGEWPYIAMEFVNGRSLMAEIAARGRCSVPWVLEMARALLGALERVHAAGLVHRDLKPENVLLTLDGQPKLADFGIALHASWERLTGTGAVLGTPVYMAPEQIVGEIVDHRTDLYALGLVLRELLYGMDKIDNLKELMLTRLDPSPVRLPADPPLPLQFHQVLTELLAMDPAHRPSSAREALDRLRLPARSRKIEAPLHENESAPAAGKTAARPSGRGLLAALVPLLLLLAIWRFHHVTAAGRADRMRVRFEIESRRLVVQLTDAEPRAAWLTTHGPDGRLFDRIPVSTSTVVTEVPTTPQLAVRLLDREDHILAEKVLNLPADRLEVYNLDVIPGLNSAIVDFGFDGPDPTEFLLESPSLGEKRRVVPRGISPHHVHMVLDHLHAATSYCLSIRAAGSWGGIRGHWFRTLTLALVTKNQGLCKEIEGRPWDDPESLLDMDTIRKHRDPAYIDALEKKLRREGVSNVIDSVAGLMDDYHARETPRLLVRDWATLNTLPPPRRQKALRHLGLLGDPRAIDEARRILVRDGKNAHECGWFVQILARGRSPADARLVTSLVEQGHLPVDDVSIAALYRFDPAKARQWFRSKLGSPLASSGLAGLATSADAEFVHLIDELASEKHPMLSDAEFAVLLIPCGPAAAPVVWKLFQRSPKQRDVALAAGLLQVVRAVPKLKQILVDQAAPMALRIPVALALGLTGDRRATPVLRRALAEGPTALAQACAWSLGRLVDQKARPLLEKLALDAEEKTGVAFWALGKLANPASRPLLQSAILHLVSTGDAGSDQCRLAMAVWALGRLGAADDLPVFRKVLERKPKPFVKRQVEKALGILTIDIHHMEYFMFPFVILDRPGLALWPEDDLQMELHGGWGYRKHGSFSSEFVWQEGTRLARMDQLEIAGFTGQRVFSPADERCTQPMRAPDGRSEVFLTSNRYRHHTIPIPVDRDWIGVLEVVLSRP